MKKAVHKFFCCILTISLVWLPLATSANDSGTDELMSQCKEMHSAMPLSLAVNEKMAQNVSQHQHTHTTTSDSCEHCVDGWLSCAMSSCGHSINKVSDLLTSTQNSIQLSQLTLLFSERSAHYKNPKITPDIRPPVI